MCMISQNFKVNSESATSSPFDSLQNVGEVLFLPPLSDTSNNKSN